MRHIVLKIKHQIAKLPLPFWISFYIFLLLIIIPVLAYIGTFNKAAPGSLSVTIDQKTGTNDPSPSYTSVFTVQFSEAIDKTTFTSTDITLAGTAPGQQVQSITEAGTFNQTTYEVRIQATGAGTITPSIAQELITAQASPTNTNNVSTSTDNSVTYNGSWSPDEFIIRVKTDNPGGSASNEFIIPASGNGYSYDFSVDCDNNGTNEFTNQTGDVTCTYGSDGEYDIAMTGSLPFWYSAGKVNQAKILDVKQWGDMQWENMEGMFSGASAISSFTALDSPDLSLVTSLGEMFAGTINFNSDINYWDVGNINEVGGMFNGAINFNQPLNNWNTSSFTSMAGMFEDAHSFNQPLNNWNTGNVTYMAWIFRNATSFNQPLNNWDVSKITYMYELFRGATNFNGDISTWDTGNVTYMAYMFSGAISFNQPLNNWDISNVTNMTYMFVDADSFNQPLNNWNTSSVMNMEGMFQGADNFNGDVANWNTVNVVNMSGMFAWATNFNKSLDSWNVANVTSMSVMFFGSGLSTANYDSTLIGWSTQSLQNNVTFGAGTSKYCDSEAQRQSIITNFNWTINDSGKDCTVPLGIPQNLTGDPYTVYVDLDWDDVTGADHYKLEYKKSSDSTWTEYTDNSITGSSISITGLDFETSYDFRVKTVDNTNNESDWSSILTISTLAQQTYHITNCQELQSIMINPVTLEMGDLSGHYILDNDIDCTETTTWTWEGLLYYLINNDPVGFINIGVPFDGAWFTGILDGQDYTISNLYQDTTYFQSFGIFGGTQFAAIKNVRFTDYKRNIGSQEIWATSTGLNSGGLVGKALSTNIDDVNFSGAQITGFSNTNFGGLVGSSMEDSTVNESSFQGDVSLIKYDDFGKYTSVAGITTDLAGNVYVIDGGGYRIIKYDNTGEPQLSWGSQGMNSGQFLEPHDIVADGNGYVYVSDNARNIVQKFDGDGTYIDEFDGSNSVGGAFSDISALAVDNNDNLYVLDVNGAGRITKLSSNGSYITELTVPYSNSGGSIESSSMAVDNNEDIFVITDFDHKIVKLDQAGNQLLEFGNLGPGSGDGQFANEYISGIAIDASNNIYLGDPFNNRIQKFNNNGGFMSVFADGVITADAHGLSNSAVVMTADTNGDLVVSMKSAFPSIIRINSSGLRVGEIGEFGPLASNVDGITPIFGGLSAILFDTSITKSYSDINASIEITSNGNFGTVIGGIVGFTPVGASLDNVYSRGTYITDGPQPKFAGLVTHNFDATILHSYSAINITTTNNIPVPENSIEEIMNGGAIGSTYSNANISDVFSVGRITSSIPSAGLIGTIIYGNSIPPLPPANGNINDLYYDPTTTEQDNCIGVYYDADSQTSQSLPVGICTPVNTDGSEPNYFKNNTTNPPLNQWDFTNIWKTTCSYPTFVHEPCSPTSSTAPTAPLNPSISDITTTSMKLNWQAPASDGGSAITSYQVQYKASSSPTWINAPAQGSSPTSHIFTSLSPNTSYDFKVSAINNVGSSPYTSPISATTLTVSTPPVDPPTNPTTPTTPTNPTTPTTPPVDPTTPTTNTDTNQPEPNTPVYTPSTNNRSSSQPKPLTPAKTNLPILGAVIGPLVSIAEHLPKPVARGIPYSLLVLLIAISTLYGYSSYMENQRRKSMQALITRFKNLLASRATYLRITSHYISTPITKMQATIELLSMGVASTSSSTSSGSSSRSKSSNKPGSNQTPGSQITPNSNPNSTTSSNTASSSEPLPPPVALSATTTTLTIPENAIVAAQSGLKSLSSHADELLAEGQSLAGRQQANIHNLEQRKGLSFLTHPAFWLPIVIISTIVTLLNIIFIQAERYTPTAITIASQLLLGFVGVITLAVSYYFYQQHKAQTKLTKQQQDIESELNLRQANFITEASNKLSDDLLVLEGVAKDIAKYPKVAGFNDGLKDLKQRP